MRCGCTVLGGRALLCQGTAAGADPTVLQTHNIEEEKTTDWAPYASRTQIPTTAWSAGGGPTSLGCNAR